MSHKNEKKPPNEEKNLLEHSNNVKSIKYLGPMVFSDWLDLETNQRF